MTISSAESVKYVRVNQSHFGNPFKSQDKNWCQVPVISDHVPRLADLGFSSEMVEQFQNLWNGLESEGYEMYAIYTGVRGSSLEDKAACIICSKSSDRLEWQNVVTPSMDSVAIFCTCQDCRSQYVETALRQKALGRLLKERNTRPN